MHDLAGHLRFALRQLRRNPGFSLTSILTLAIGIGATTAIFSIFYAVLLRPLPFPEPDRLASVSVMSFPAGSGANAIGVPEHASYPDFFDWRAQNHSFESLASYHDLNASANPNGAARMISGVAVSADFFHVLGIQPAIGRAFTRDEEKTGNHSVVISHEFWVSDFNASPSILGQTIKLLDVDFTVVGVMPASFSFPIETPSPSFWITPARDAEGKDPSTGQRGWMQLDSIGRLKPGVTIAQAQAEMNTIQAGLAKRYPVEDLNNRGAQVVSEAQTITGDVRPALRILFAAVAALLLISCANVAGLLLARGSARQSELAVRAALGARRREIVLQLLAESLLLSLMGGVAGIALAVFMLKELLHLVPAGIPRVGEASIDGTVLAFTLGVSLLTGVLFGLLPARRLSHLDPALALRDGTRTSTSGRRQHRLHSLLVIAETALGLVLLVGAGLLIRSFLHVLAVDPGFNPRHMLTFRVGVSPKRYKEDADSLAFYRNILTRLQALPGVSSATAVYPLPLSGSGIGITFDIEGRPHAPGDSPEVRVSIVEPSFFQTMGIPILRGRTFSEDEDQPKGRPVTMVNQAFVRKFFPGEDPIGKRIQPDLASDDNPKAMHEIIAVTADVKRDRLTEEATPEIYLPYAPMNITSPYYAMRATGDPLSYINSVRAAVASLDKDAPIYRIHTYDDLVALNTAQSRFQTLLLTAFAAIALLLAAIGLYAVLSYTVVQRTHEIGLRMALGAQRGNVLKLILNRGMALAVIGVTLGSGISALLTRFLGSLLYDVKPLDSITFICVAGVLLAVSAIASSIPASRAAALDPMKTLRDQ
jgi:putative ABC transport system permease protein